MLHRLVFLGQGRKSGRTLTLLELESRYRSRSCVAVYRWNRLKELSFVFERFDSFFFEFTYSIAFSISTLP
jgi:hypothetical protein